MRKSKIHIFLFFSLLYLFLSHFVYLVAKHISARNTYYKNQVKCQSQGTQGNTIHTTALGKKRSQIPIQISPPHRLILCIVDAVDDDDRHGQARREFLEPIFIIIMYALYMCDRAVFVHQTNKKIIVNYVT